MKKILGLGLLAALLLTLLCGCGFSINFGIYQYPNGQNYTAGSEASFSAPIDAIDVDWPAGAVKIAYHEKETVELCETVTGSVEPAEDEIMHYWLDGTTLRVKFAASGRTLLIMPQKELTILLPRSLMLDRLSVDVASAEADIRTDARKTIVQAASGEVTLALSDGESVDVSTASGAVSAKLAQMADVSIDTASGKITLDASQVTGAVELDSASGDMTLTVGTAKRLTAETSSGEIELAAGEISEVSFDSASGDIRAVFTAMPRDCEIDTASGGIRLTLPKDASFVAEVDTASGDFDCEFAVVRKGNRYTCGTGEARLELESASGNIRVLAGN